MERGGRARNRPTCSCTECRRDRSRTSSVALLGPCAHSVRGAKPALRVAILVADDTDTQAGAGVNQRRELWLFDDAPILGGAELFALRLVHWTHGDAGNGWCARLFCPGESELARRGRHQAVDV